MKLETHIDVMDKVLLLVDLVGLNAVLLSQAQDPVLGGPDIGPAQIHPLGLLVLETERKPLRLE